MLDKGEVGCFDESYRALIEKRSCGQTGLCRVVWLLREGHTTRNGLSFSCKDLVPR